MPIRRSARRSICVVNGSRSARAVPPTETCWRSWTVSGLSPSDVTLVFLQPADALGAFTQRQVDAWAIWDPYTAQAEADIPCPQHRGGGRHHQRCGIRYRLGRSAGRSETEHRAERPVGAVRQGRALGEGPSRPVGAAITPPRSALTRRLPLRRRPEACGCPPLCRMSWWDPNRNSPTFSPNPSRSTTHRSSTTGSTAATAMRSTRC